MVGNSFDGTKQSKVVAGGFGTASLNEFQETSVFFVWLRD